ncbi:hypothetical protein LXA43DRAFT_984708 [Ganoderma leucocontextum]|nr:hypothetical protein LXA43DRAFT_984708 [Ganoderma leucocontextum]
MDHLDPNSLSEAESLSDSDWLDISSRASEDNDSLDDSDCEDLASDYRPPSRRSLASFGSSPEGEIQGWEGIIEDSSDEAPLTASPDGPEEDAATHDPILHLSQQSLSFRAAALSEAAVARSTAHDDPEEDRKVKDGLDQSMVSTLSASRSNSLNASIQTSIVHSRDLRLSFPDPLSSSSPRTHPLSPSYEDISIDTGADIAPSEQETQTQDSTDVEAAPTAAPVSTTTPPADGPVDASDHMELHSSATVDFSIILYGASSEAKHRVAQRILEKLMAATECGFSSLPQIDVPQNIRALITAGRSAQSHCIISIVDRTENVLSNSGKWPSALVLAERPSLAIVFLPSANVTVPDHTLYLPVLHQDEVEEEDDIDTFTPVDRLLDAEHQWDTLRVAKGRLVSRAFTSSGSTVVEEEEIERASPAKVRRALQPLLPWTNQWSSYHLASRPRHAITLFAILSIVLGYLVNGSLPLPGLRRASATVGMVARPAPTPVANASLPTPAASPSNVGLIASSLKELALAAVSPYAVASTSSVATKSSPSTTASLIKDAGHTGAPSECACGCGLITWPEMFKPTTDLVLRPTPPTPALSNQASSKGPALAIVAPPPMSGKGKARAIDTDDESLYALSTRLAGALSEYLDLDVSTVLAQKRNDAQEILDALDELARTIHEQTGSVWEQSKSTVEAAREGLLARHERAKTRAKELRAVGGRLFESVSAEVRGRVSMAKENARMLRENVRVRREESFRGRRDRREGRWERRMEWRAARAERRASRAQPVD